MIKMDGRDALKVAGNHMRGENEKKNADEHQLLRHLFCHGATIPEMRRQFGQNIAHLRRVSAMFTGIDLAGSSAA
jgi:hypothetical protein